MKKAAFAILAAAILSSLQGAEASFVQTVNVQGLSFGREAVTGYLRIERDGVVLPLNQDHRINFYLQGAFEFGGSVYMLVYDTHTNMPSGRTLQREFEGNDLYRLEIDAGGQVSFHHIKSVPMGIDIKLQIATLGKELFACGTTTCIKMIRTSDGDRAELLNAPPSTEIIELVPGYALVQRQFSDQFEEIPDSGESIFMVCRLADSINSCTDIPPDQIPYRLTADGSYLVMTDPEDVLRYDFDRLGVANFSEPNLEGRIVWSNVYFLCGVAALADMAVGENFKRRLRRRLTEELEAIARLGEMAYPQYRVRRYSLDREPVDFLLHFSRIAKMTQRARSIIGDALPNRILQVIVPELRKPTKTVEMIGTAPRAEIQYRPYAPFWADGSNVPWNYQNAWIEGISLTGIPAELRETISAMLATFVADEKLDLKPNKWNYAGGTFHRGWESGVSTNSPHYVGDAARRIPAHISYRSMDALGMLEAERAGLPSLNHLQEYISDLISRGYLYPFVNEGLDKPVEIPFGIARHYARSTLPWQFQNQAWVLGGMLEP